MDCYKDFIRAADGDCNTQLDRAVALLWFAGREDPVSSLSTREIADVLHAVGHPRQNISRLDRGLKVDKRTAIAPGGGWRLRPLARRELDAKYLELLGPRPLPSSDSIIPMEFVAGTRGYIQRVVEQVNKSFDGQLYDCCSVMCRRLIETLIIEVYESVGRQGEIKGSDGHYLQFAELLAYIQSDQKISISRPGVHTLKDVKKLGDLSAHNRRYNARRGDIEPHRSGLRQIVEELVHIAFPAPSAAQ